MILPEAFNKNESLRLALLQARPIIDLVFHAADNAEDLEARLDDVNVLTNAQHHAGRVAINRYKARIRSMYGAAQSEPSPLLDEHLGMDPFDRIAAEAEKEAAAAEEKSKRKKKL